MSTGGSFGAGARRRVGHELDETKALWRTLSTGDKGEAYREEVQQKLDSMTVEELRTEVQGLLFLLEMADELARSSRGRSGASVGSIRTPATDRVRDKAGNTRKDPHGESRS